MVRRALSVIAASVVLLVPLSARSQDRIFSSDSVEHCFAHLLQRAAWGLQGSSERAAFVVRAPDGATRCVLWPPTHRVLEEAFDGPMPSGTVAIVHTHPALYPKPSQHDVDESVRVRVPFYVISIHGVYRIDPRDGTVSQVALGQKWIHSTPRGGVAIAGGVARRVQAGKR